MGHPVNVYTPKRLKEINEAIKEYSETTEIPILAEFAFNYGILREELYRHPELRYAIKDLITKKEFQLERKAMSGETNTTFAIFSLKQIGWSDKTEVEHSGNPEKPIKYETYQKRDSRIKDLIQKRNVVKS